jgi:hypothetical protein
MQRKISKFTKQPTYDLRNLDILADDYKHTTILKSKHIEATSHDHNESQESVHTKRKRVDDGISNVGSNYSLKQFDPISISLT